MNLNRDSNGRSPWGLFLLGALLVAFSIGVIGETLRMPRPEPWGVPAAPGLVPFLAAALTLILSLALTLAAARRGGFRELGPGLRETVSQGDSRRLVCIILITAVYVALLGWVPFLAATLLFHLLIFAYLRAAGPLGVLVYAAAASLLVALLLPFLFDMPTP